MTASRMSRRDRAALCLALECVRYYPLPDEEEAGQAVSDAIDALRLPMWGADNLATLRTAVYAENVRDGRIELRVLRARLALLLRCLLRADAGDVYSQPCKACEYNGREGRMVAWPRKRAMLGGATRTYARCDRCDDDCWLSSMRITPAWELAPAHTDQTPRQRRGER